MIKNKQKRNVIIVLTLSIALHIAILIYLFFAYKDNTKEETLVIKPKKQESTPVYFQGMSQPQSVPPAPQIPIQKNENENENEKQAQEEPKQEQAKHQESTQEKKPPQKKEPKQEEIKKREPETTELKKIQQEQPKKEISTEKKDMPTLSKKPIKNIEKPHIAPDVTETMIKKLAETLPDKPRKLPSLTEFSKGFLNYARSQGTNLISYTKSAQGMPTEEQLKHERYIQKIFKQIETILKIKRREFALTQIPFSENFIIDIQMLLQKNGNISNLRLTKSSGSQMFDIFMVRVLQDASSSFPPVPDYFNVEQYFLPVRFHIPTTMFRRINS